MKRKSIFLIIMAAILIFSISILGCKRYNTPYNNNYTGNNFTTTPDNNDNNNAVKNAADAAKDKVDDASNSLKYTAMNFKDDIKNAGYKLKDSLNTKKDYFKGNETDYLMGNDLVRVYEYNSKADLENDINRIAPDGLTVRGTNAKYTTRPYYYRRGNSLVVYEGNEPAYIDEFRNIYGNPIVP